jgi:glycerol-3-phosphate O-acyltransferase
MVFIRRSMKGAAVYKAVLREYLSYLMRSQENLEWYMEGGRTRLGKLRQPRLGILSYVVQAFERDPSKDVYLIPVSVMYDQQHEVEAISAEELGGNKSPEDIKWMLKFFAAQSTRLGSAHLRFGEPLSLSKALLVARSDADGDDQIAVPKIAFEVSHRVNQATPIMPSALITFALLENEGRALTLSQGRQILEPLLNYVEIRGLPVTASFDLSSNGSLAKQLRMLLREGVVEEYDGGLEPVYSIANGREHEAGFYRNSVSHLFITRAIIETALIKVAEDGTDDILEDTFEEARRLRDLLKFEFFFPRTIDFAGDVMVEADILYPGWQDDTFDSDELMALIAASPLHLAHRVLGPFVEAYGVVADRLAARKLKDEVKEDDFIQECIGLAQQRWLQKELHSPESISKDLFGGALELAGNRGLLDPKVTKRARVEFAAEIADVIRRVELIRQFADRKLATSDPAS